jgi:tetratricopeptide (TPR) repeat protein
LASEYDGALRTYQEMRAFASQQGHAPMELAALMAITTLHVAPTPLFDASKGEAVGDQALALARELNDERAEAKILWNFCILGRFTGHDEEALEHGEQSLAIARRLDMVEQIGFTLTDLYWCYLAVGDLQQAGEALSEAQEKWDATNNLPMTVDNLSSSVFLYYLRGEYKQGILASEQAWRLSQEIDNLWGKSFGLMYTGLVYMDLGQYDRALKTMRLSEHLSVEAGFMVPQIAIPLWMSIAYGDLGLPGKGLKLIEGVYSRVQAELPFLEPGMLAVRAYLQALHGQSVEAREDMERARQLLPKTSTLNLLIPVASIEAEVAEASGDHDFALSQLDGSMRFLEKAGSPPLIADALYLKGRALFRKGDLEGAKRAALAALSRLRGIPARRVLWQIYALMRSVELALGDSPQAAEYAQKARSLVHYIADHVGEERLRAAFLQRRQVQELLEP